MCQRVIVPYAISRSCCAASAPWSDSGTVHRGYGYGAGEGQASGDRLGWDDCCLCAASSQKNTSIRSILGWSLATRPCKRGYAMDATRYLSPPLSCVRTLRAGGAPRRRGRPMRRATGLTGPMRLGPVRWCGGASRIVMRDALTARAVRGGQQTDDTGRVRPKHGCTGSSDASCCRRRLR